MIISQVLAGVGVASGIAVGGLLAERLSGTVALAGFAQTSSVLGAGLWAIPLARLAGRRGRRWGLAAGYLLALVGTGLVFLAAAVQFVPLLFVGTAAFGAATAAGLQARFAAAEVVGVRYRARALSVVMWATTLGSVAGPNLSEVGSRLGRSLGIEPLTGPYLFSLIAFAGAAMVLSVGLAGRGTTEVDHDPSRLVQRPTGLVRAIRTGLQDPRTRLAIIAVICSHTIMVGVMVMTPLHMTHHGMTLDLVGLVLSIHIFGMYGASPIMGWLTDRLGGAAVIGIGVIIFAGALVLGGFADTTTGPVISLALGLLGLGWSAGMIGGSSLLAESVSDQNRVSLQGGTDALMNLAAAGSSALSGLVMGLAGFPALNLIAAVVAVPMAVLALRGMLARRAATGA
ncbi:MFS transporter [Microlunatus parietis]|uniref:MFS family permease n=1 Tax=Microlunatus parietis TaxID=682979 RepID=A0A7Y9L8L9_9ACTN|nr:MFS transporter [Microlunatus parietis]NYE70904.1 MFS family permease [Microlunatus parietis]